MNTDVLVVGAGVAGLRCALALADAGLRVTVLEAAPHAGGRAASWSDEETGLQVDVGPHALSSEYRNFLAMLRRLGTDEQVLWQRRPLVALVDGRGAVRMPAARGLAPLARMLARLSLRDAPAHLRIAWRAARLDDHALRELDVDDLHGWLRAAGVRPHAIEAFWRSAALALLHAPPEQCSAAAMLRVFRPLLGRGHWHVGFPKIGLAQLYVPGSCRAVLRSGGQVLFGARAGQLLVERGRAAGVRTTDGHELRAGCLVLALPPQEAAVLAADSGEAALQPLANAARYFRPSASVSTYLWFDRPIGTERFWARMWTPQGLNTGFYDLAHIRPGLTGRPSVVACNAIGTANHADWPDERIVEHSWREVAEFAPRAREARVLHARVHRTAMSVPQPRPGTEAVRPPAATALPGLWVAGDWTDTAVACSMESAARSGALAAEAVLADLGQPAAVAVEPPPPTGLAGWLRRR